MKKMLWVLLVICLLLPMTALATPPVNVQGDFFYYPTGCDVVRLAKDNLIQRNCGDTGLWNRGDFLGESKEEYDVVLHGYQGLDDQGLPVYDYAFYKGTVTFTGTVTVDSVTRWGTLTLKMVGTSTGDIGDWSGTWRIIDGTEGLATLHGNGVHESNGLLDVHYEGQVHFEPN